uniref:Uncharacterized protein n=1 Tax=Oryza brachyantha TaxID=4533 RepID=J3NCK0_ORYBR
MDEKHPSCTTERAHAECSTPTPTTHATPDHDDEICDLPEEFHVLGHPLTSSPNPFPMSLSMQEDDMIYAGDLGYMSTLCSSPSSNVDDLYPPKDNDTIILHPAFVDDGDIDIINEDIYNFMCDQTLLRDAQSLATRFK